MTRRATTTMSSSSRLSSRAVLLTLGLAAGPAATTVSALSEMDTLIRFYNLANGRHWQNSAGWAEASAAVAAGRDVSETEYASVCSWYGVQCKESATHHHHAEDTVDTIDLSYNHLSGKVSHHLWTLPNLKTVNLHGNLLTDAGLLGFAENNSATKSPLEKLTLSENRLTTLEGLDSAPSSLKHLAVGSNAFEGHFPEQILRLKKLHTLRASYNSGLTGPFPAEIGDLTNLRELELSYTGLKGTIPTEMGNLVHLEYLSLDDNRLHGEIPFELTELIKLKYLSLRSSELGEDAGGVSGRQRLTGPLPPFKDCGDLKELYLDGNAVSGPVPPDLLEFSLLKSEPVSVDLRNNRLSGRVPAELADRFDLLEIELGGNKINGIPDELCEKEGWMTGAVEAFGCNGILCPRGTYRPGSGRREDPDDQCKACPGGVEDAPHLGSMNCEGGQQATASDGGSGTTDGTEDASTESHYKPPPEKQPNGDTPHSSGPSVSTASASVDSQPGLGGGAIFAVTLCSLLAFAALLLLVRRRSRRRRMLRDIQEARDMEKAEADGVVFGAADASGTGHMMKNEEDMLEVPLDVPGSPGGGVNRCIL